jgi:outer membrane protein OmpA-like peptidoglycan-associated protein
MKPRILLLLGAGAVGACTPYVPAELGEARRVYDEAARGPAATAAPAELHKAAVALSDAEHAYADDPRAQHTRDLAYIADRRARTATALGRLQLAQRTREGAEREYAVAERRIINEQRAALGESQRAASSAQAAAGRAEQRAASAEKEAKDVQAKLLELARVKEEARGMVITLTGSVLFASNQATLLPDAERRLDQVAGALLSNHKERKIIIEGYTDSRGSETFNLDLSRRRAEAVRAYLVGKGYDPDLISSTGLGKASPVADNASAEGRANNRRVEIVVKNKGD